MATPIAAFLESLCGCKSPDPFAPSKPPKRTTMPPAVVVPWEWALSVWIVVVAIGFQAGHRHDQQGFSGTILRPRELHDPPLWKHPTHQQPVPPRHWHPSEMPGSVSVVSSTNRSALAVPWGFPDNATAIPLPLGPSFPKHGPTPASVVDSFLVHPILLSHEHPERVALILEIPSTRDASTIARWCQHRQTLITNMLQHRSVLSYLAVVQVGASPEPECPRSSLFSSSSTVVDIETITVATENHRGGDGGKLPGRLSDLDAVVVDTDAVFDFLSIHHLRDCLAEDGRIAVALRRKAFHAIVREWVHEGPNEQRNMDEVELEEEDEDEEDGFELFEAALDYQVWDPDSRKIQNYAVAFADATDLATWHQNEAWWNLRIHQRQVMKGAEEKFFDGASMVSIEYPSVLSEKAFCARFPFECEGPRRLDPALANVAQEDLFIAPSTVGENAGRGIFTRIPIPPNAYIDLDRTSRPIRASWQSFDLVYELQEESDIEGVEEAFRPVAQYMAGYGFIEHPWGRPEYVVDASVVTFINHGCNFTNNLGTMMSVSEYTIDPTEAPPKELTQDLDSGIRYNPRKHRDMTIPQFITVSNRAILAGEELLDNYLAFGGAQEDFAGYMRSLRNECSGVAGLIENFQAAHAQKQHEPRESEPSPVLCGEPSASEIRADTPEG